jgi:hypothetical protein
MFNTIPSPGINPADIVGGANHERSPALQALLIADFQPFGILPPPVDTRRTDKGAGFFFAFQARFQRLYGYMAFIVGQDRCTLVFKWLCHLKHSNL